MELQSHLPQSAENLRKMVKVLFKRSGTGLAGNDADICTGCTRLCTLYKIFNYIWKQYLQWLDFNLWPLLGLWMAATLETSHHLLEVHCVGHASPLITSWSGSGSITSPSVLAYPNFDRWFVLHTDASRHGLGAVLEQEHDDGLFHPIAYASRTLSKHEKRHGVTDMEGWGPKAWSLLKPIPVGGPFQCVCWCGHFGDAADRSRKPIHRGFCWLSDKVGRGVSHCWSDEWDYL